MSFDDPEYIECTCVQRSLRDEEKILFFVPPSKKMAAHVITYAKDCPIHGYTVEENKPVDDKK